MDDRNAFEEINGYSFDLLRSGDVVPGPAIIWSSNTTVVLRMMERDGLIRRARDASDRRNFKIFITAKGRRLKDEIAHCGVRGNLTAMAGFSQQEVRQVQALLKRMIRNVETVQ